MNEDKTTDEISWKSHSIGNLIVYVFGIALSLSLFHSLFETQIKDERKSFWKILIAPKIQNTAVILRIIVFEK
jgi:hypothetical protein